MLDPVVNFGKVTLANLYGATDTSVQLVTGQGAILPNPGSQGDFNLVWYNDTDYPDPADDPDREIVRVTENSTDILTITRAQEGTTATAKNIAGKTYKMINALTAAVMAQIAAGIAAGSINFVDEEKVSGSGTSWILEDIPETGSVHLFIKGSRSSVQAGDYTINGKNITTALPWSYGDLIADYRV